LFQLRTAGITTAQIMIGQIMIGQIMIGQIMIGQITTAQIMIVGHFHFFSKLRLVDTENCDCSNRIN